MHILIHHNTLHTKRTQKSNFNFPTTQSIIRLLRVVVFVANEKKIMIVIDQLIVFTVTKMMVTA
jgi:hypothetical protein